jgi:hypothetical protein
LISSSSSPAQPLPTQIQPPGDKPLLPENTFRELINSESVPVVSSEGCPEYAEMGGKKAPEGE